MYLYTNHQARRKKMVSYLWLLLTRVFICVSDETLLAVRSPVEDDEDAQLKALQAELAM